MKLKKNYLAIPVTKRNRVLFHEHFALHAKFNLQEISLLNRNYKSIFIFSFKICDNINSFAKQMFRNLTTQSVILVVLEVRNVPISYLKFRVREIF